MMGVTKIRFGEFKKTDRKGIGSFYADCEQSQIPAVWIERRRNACLVARAVYSVLWREASQPGRLASYA